MQERRSEVRMMCADMMEVRWLDGSRFRRGMALLEDISQSGACLQMESPVPLGVKICWQSSPRQSFSGMVRYCAYREIGYFIGVEFDAGSRWSRRTYRPPHMLDPQTLLAGARSPRD